MVLFTDCPARLEKLIGSEVFWESPGERDLPESVRGLAQLLGEMRFAFAKVAGSGCFGRWDCLAVVENARGSQFDLLTKAARENLALPDHVACLALAGEKFHGNRDRAWQALEGNIHLSTFHRTNASSDKLGQGLTMVPPLAALDAVRKSCPDIESTGTKWVNDVLINRHKVAGAITSTQRKDGRIESVCWGIGMNVLTTPRISPVGAALPPTSLAGSSCQRPPVFWEVVCSLLAALSDRRTQLVEGGSDAVFSDYRANLVGIGERVSIWPEETTDFVNEKPLAQGTLRKVNPDLSLVLEGHPGSVHRGRLVLDHRRI